MLHKFCEVFSPSLSVPSSNLQSVKIRLDWNPKNIEHFNSKNLADRLAQSHFRDSLTQNMLKSNPGELTLQKQFPSNCWAMPAQSGPVCGVVSLLAAYICCLSFDRRVKNSLAVFAAFAVLDQLRPAVWCTVEQ